VSRLGERLDGHRQRANALDEALKPDEEQVPALPDSAVRQALAVALREAQSLGNVARQRADLDRQTSELEGTLKQALSDLGTGSEPGLRSSQPVLEAQIAHTKQELAKSTRNCGKRATNTSWWDVILTGNDYDNGSLPLRAKLSQPRRCASPEYDAPKGGHLSGGHILNAHRMQTTSLAASMPIRHCRMPSKQRRAS